MVGKGLRNARGPYRACRKYVPVGIAAASAGFGLQDVNTRSVATKCASIRAV